ncbi:hypothetical protein [Pararhodobacter zhoushanensis]|uniref:HEAT repeat domain-containing protein n=1 Tax=Pararhodobacter zhoushanensis TaxID=2479545 RepID=A0ABT3GXV9_9RHOB|nr:hypothetical protein [Pararhodobacter zhoushanensis]MCW1932390.1 hypothetical protein [Pararhodobacter zhoushanensis]
MRLYLRLVAALCLLTAPVSAQVVTPRAGEHADFTRLVLAVPAGTGWRLSPDGRSRALTIEGAAIRFDLSQLFRRIPRTRLADATAEGPVLTLTMDCACPVTAWEERPGLIVLDIGNPPPEEPAQETPLPPALPTSPPRRPPPLDPIATARSAGTQLARAMPLLTAGPEEAVAEDPRLATLAEDLGRTVAQALGQGILDAAIDAPIPDVGLLSSTPTPDLPANMRVTTVMDRADPGALTVARPPEFCQGADRLESLLTQNTEDFSAEHGRLARALYGEFDQPDPAARAALVGLYLSAGFGAEAHALLVNSQDIVAGRDFALGVADVLEDRATNSRMRLAQAIDCGGIAALMAVLAGADADAVRQNDDAIALTYSLLSPSLRARVGLPLAERLAEVGALDAARIVADSLRRSSWTVPQDVALAEALLDRARGHPVDAAARLEHEGGSNAETVQTRLDLALQTQNGLDSETLEGAAALAAAARTESEGAELMASVIRLHARSGSSPDAFAALDRLESWVQETGENRRLIETLRDEVWAALADTGSDFGIVETVLAREDWRAPGLTPQTRRKLAKRLLDLGLVTPVHSLVGTLDDPEARVLRARAWVSEGDPEQALTLLADDHTTDARQTRAAALGQIGDHAGAAAEFAALGVTDAEARAVILAGDWRRLETLHGAEAPPTADAAGLSQILGRTPGHAEVARAQADQSAPQAHEAATQDAAPTGAEPATPDRANADPDLSPQEPQARAAPRMPGDGTPIAEPPPTAEVGRSSVADLATGPIPDDPGAIFNRFGLVRRSSTLLAESERLREALTPLVQVRN